MAYVGTPIDTRNTFQSLAGKRFNGDGSTTAFTLDVAPSSTLDIEVFVGNVRQDPNSAYTLSGTTLTFTGAPPSGTNNIYVVHQAKAVGTIDVPASGVQAGSLASSILTGQTDIGADIADADLFLVDDGAGGTVRKTAASRLKTYASGLTGVTTGSGNVTITNGNLVLGTSGKGIDFSATGDGDGTDTSELLEDYEEGTWTPTFYDAASGGNQLTTSSSSGNYIKVGNLIRINCRCTINSISGATGGNAVRMRGLPYGIFNQTGNDAVGKAEIWGTGTDIDSEMTALPSDAGAVAIFKYRASAGTARPSSITVTILGASATIISSLTYRTS